MEAVVRNGRVVHPMCACAVPEARRKKRRLYKSRALAIWMMLVTACVFGVYTACQNDVFLTGLDVDPVLQNPQLPNGCEAASLAAVLNSLGVQVDKMDLAYAYIPRVDFSGEDDARVGANPETAYPGDPATSCGFYCFAAPVSEGANKLLAERGSELHAVDTTGVTESGLRWYLDQGDAVIVWTTLDFSAPRTGSFIWTDGATGETIIPFINLHCIVLTGMGERACIVVDPLEGTRRVDKAEFLNSFTEVGSRAVVIH